MIESNFLLCHDLPSTCVEGEPQDIYCEEVPFDGTDNFETTDDIQESSLTCIPFNEFYDISQACFKEMVDIYVDSMSITFAEISEIEKNTRGQMSSEHWWNYRKERLTASKFYSAAVNTVEPSKKINSMLYTKLSTPGMCHGISHETEALNKYVESLTAKSLFVTADNPGLIISKTHPYLGASLDAIITNIDTCERWGVEIKCPSSKFNQPLQDVLKDKSFYLRKKDGSICLKESHSYYYQIQGQMFCSQLKRVDFVVWFGNDLPLHVQTVTFYEKFWQKALPRIDYFYRRALVPELFTLRVSRGEKLYQHGGWKKYSEQ